MPGIPLHTDAIILGRQPTAESFQQFRVFSPESGLLHVLQRTSSRSKTGPAPAVLDLFDEVSLHLESSNQGHTWFVKEARLLTRHTGIGRNYDALRLASGFASLICRNPVSDESRQTIHALLRHTFDAFARGASPEAVYLKALYCFARDEGHPVRAQWLESLPAARRREAETILQTPLAALDTPSLLPAASLISALEDYLSAHTEIMIDQPKA